MSTRGNGMIAHVAKPGNLNDALEKVMLTEDHASPIPEPPPTVEPQSPPIESNTDAKTVARRNKTEKGTDGGILGELTALQPVDSIDVDVGAHDLVTEMGEAHGSGQPDVARTDDGDAYSAARCSLIVLH